eukprot:5448550-Prymnesium_polylepis.1
MGVRWGYLWVRWQRGACGCGRVGVGGCRCGCGRRHVCGCKRGHVCDCGRGRGQGVWGGASMCVWRACLISGGMRAAARDGSRARTRGARTRGMRAPARVPRQRLRGIVDEHVDARQPPEIKGNQGQSRALLMSTAIKGIVDEHVDARQPPAQLLAKALDRAHVGELERPTNLESATPAAKIGLRREARRAVCGEACRGDDVGARTQQLEHDLIADPHPARAIEGNRGQ